MSYRFEKDMSTSFTKYLKIFSKKHIKILKEKRGIFGIPDYIIMEKLIDNETLIVSLELKLNNWKKALTQAFKYRCFSNLAFVIIDADNIHAAIRNKSLFERYNIGLSSFDKNGTLVNHYSPKFQEPLSKYQVTVLHKVINKKIRIVETEPNSSTLLNMFKSNSSTPTQ